MTKKEDILYQSMVLFSKEGYDAVGVARIVKTAGVTKPTLYHHFGNKEGLLLSIYDHYFSPFMDQLDQELTYQGDLMAVFHALFTRYLIFAKQFPAMYQLHQSIRKGPVHSPAKLCLAQHEEKERAILTRLLETVADHHTNLKGKTGFLLVSLLGLIDAYVTEAMNQDQTAQEGVEKMTKQYLYGVFSL